MRKSDSTMRRLGLGLFLVCSLASCCRQPPAPSLPPIPTDGKIDATQAIQLRLDSAGQTGGEVILSPGQFLIRGTLNVPKGVALRGSWDAAHHGDGWQVGTTLLVTGGRDQENGTPTVTMGADSALNGMTFLWPDQTWTDIHPYPWAVRGVGHHVTVENVTFVNAYQGVWIGSPDGSLHLLRNIFGCVLRRGIFIDCSVDVGRLENIHFNPHYWLSSGYPPGALATAAINQSIHNYVAVNLEAFIFGRTDWEYGLDTFVWGAKCGYRFIRTAAGKSSGQFLGMGADYCQTCVQIDALQPAGLQITNGAFTAFAGGPGTALVTAPGAGGSVELANSTFFATTHHAVWMQGDTEVTLSACHILDAHPDGDILAEKGRLIVQGCNFDQPGPTVVLRKDVVAAAITGNLQPGGLQVQNEIGKRAQIGLNQTP